jgi:hypothetical protein
LVAAAEKYDEAALKESLGPDSHDLIYTGEPGRDRATLKEFAEKARTKMTISKDPKRSTRTYILIGDEDWPAPIPIVKQPKGWYFDTQAGRQELLYRRIGGNELDAIAICRGYGEAQREYALTKHDDAKVNQYAQRILSTPGKHDGLAWRDADGNWGGPVGENLAKALNQEQVEMPQPFHGYYFKILKGQGPAAPLGAMSFIADGAMIGGFAMIAYPAQYKVTGVKTFLIGYDGVLYEKDLGPKTLEIASAIDLYNPDRSWSRTDEEQ